MPSTFQQTEHSAIHRSLSVQSPLLEIEREFNVPVEQLFEAFTTSEAIKSWWWPEGLFTDRVDIDFREGGKYFINMKGYEKGGGGMIGEFEEISKNERIVMTDQFADESGNPISAEKAGMQGVWPGLIYITFDFESVGDTTSRFHLSQEGVPQEMQKDCIRGWSESFDKLESYLNGRSTQSK